MIAKQNSRSMRKSPSSKSVGRSTKSGNAPTLSYHYATIQCGDYIFEGILTMHSSPLRDAFSNSGSAQLLEACEGSRLKMQSMAEKTMSHLLKPGQTLLKHSSKRASRLAKLFDQSSNVSSVTGKPYAPMLLGIVGAPRKTVDLTKTISPTGAGLSAKASNYSQNSSGMPVKTSIPQAAHGMR